MVTPEAVDYMAWPRALATAEILWTGGGGPQRKSSPFLRSNRSSRRELFAHFAARARRQLPHLHFLGIQEGPAFPPFLDEDGNPRVSGEIPSAVPSCELVTSLPAHRLYHSDFALDGREDTFFLSSRAASVNDVVQVLFRPEPIAGCVVVRARTGKNGRGLLLDGILKLELIPPSDSVSCGHEDSCERIPSTARSERDVTVSRIQVFVLDCRIVADTSFVVSCKCKPECVNSVGHTGLILSQ